MIASERASERTHRVQRRVRAHDAGEGGGGRAEQHEQAGGGGQGCVHGAPARQAAARHPRRRGQRAEARSGGGGGGGGGGGNGKAVAVQRLTVAAGPGWRCNGHHRVAPAEGERSLPARAPGWFG